MVTGREGLQTESVVCCTVRCCLCVWYLFVSILENIFISDMWKSFAYSCALCMCDNSAFVTVSGNSEREQVWVGKVVGGDPGELQL